MEYKYNEEDVEEGIEEDVDEYIDAHFPAPQSKNRYPDVLRRTWPTVTYPDSSTQLQSAFSDLTSLPPSLQKAWTAHLDGTPMHIAVGYTEDPLFTQLFSAASASTLPPHDATVAGSSSDALLFTPSNYHELYTGTTVAPPLVPVSAPHGSDYSTSSYTHRSANDFDHWESSPPSDTTPRSSSESQTSPPSPSPITCFICHAPFKGEYAPGNLKRHLKYVHGDSTFTCEGDACERVFKRPDARRAHYKKSHPELYTSR